MRYNVQPLRSNEEIDEFYELLGNTRHGNRNQFLFILGINTGLRMSDLVALRVIDIKDKEISYIKEKKTGKVRPIYLGEVSANIQEYLDNNRGLSERDYLFRGQCSSDHLTVNYVYKLFQKVAKQLDRDDIGTHTLRKTFGYHYYRKTKDIGSLMIIFRHSNESITKRYIGITDDEILQSLQNFKLGV